MVGQIMGVIWDAIVDFSEMIFDLFDKVGAIPYIVTFSIIGLFISFVIMNRLRVSFTGSSDTALPAGRVEHSQQYKGYDIDTLRAINGTLDISE